MQKKDRSKLKRISIDILGVLAIIAAGVTSPIPGPGGIPLLILGLSLLATNHAWAERWLLTVKKHGLSISDKIFTDSPRMKLLLDIASILLIAAAVLIVVFATKSLFRTAAISLVIASLVLFFGNRGRMQNIRQRFSRHK